MKVLYQHLLVFHVPPDLSTPQPQGIAKIVEILLILRYPISSRHTSSPPSSPALPPPVLQHKQSAHCSLPFSWGLSWQIQLWCLCSPAGFIHPSYWLELPLHHRHLGHPTSLLLVQPHLLAPTSAAGTYFGFMILMSTGFQRSETTGAPTQTIRSQGIA